VTFLATLCSIFSQLGASLLPVITLTLEPRTSIATKLLTAALYLEEFSAIVVSADADSASVQVFAPQHVVKDRSDARRQIPVGSFDRTITPRMDDGRKGVQEFL